MEGMEVLPDLVMLLKEQNAEVRYEASRLLSPFTTEHAGRMRLLELDALTTLVRLLGDISPVVHHTIISLVNMSEEPEAVKVLLKKNFIPTLVDCVTEENSKHVEMHASLLSNLTLHKEACEQLEKVGFRAVKLLNTLLNLYTQNTEKYHIIGVALVNISQTDCVRKAALEPSVQPLIIKLLASTADLSADKAHVRRTIWRFTRNLCFGELSHRALLSELGLLSYLLAPIRGPVDLPEDDKIGLHSSLHSPRPIESNTACQMLILEALTLLTGTRFGRNYLRNNKTYPILREFDKLVDENDEEKKESILRIVEVLINDEAEESDHFDTADSQNSENSKNSQNSQIPQDPQHTPKKPKLSTEDDAMEEI